MTVIVLPINQAIILYKIDQGQLPSSMNELIVKNYITLSNKPLFSI